MTNGKSVLTHTFSDDRRDIVTTKALTNISELGYMLSNATMNSWIEGIGYPDTIQDRITLNRIGDIILKLSQKGK